MARAVSRRTLIMDARIQSQAGLHVRFVVKKVALGQLFLRVLRCNLVNVIPPVLQTHFFIYDRRRISAIDNVVNTLKHISSSFKNHIEITNKMQPYTRIYYSIISLIAQHVSSDIPLIIRSSKTVIAASGLTYVCGCRQLPATTNVCQTRGCNYSF